MALQVSHHALVRWLERREGIELEPLRDRIRADPASGGHARDKVVARFIERRDAEAVAGLRAIIGRIAREAMREQGLDASARSVAIGDGWHLGLSPIQGGVSVATLNSPDMEFGRPVRPWKGEKA